MIMLQTLRTPKHCVMNPTNTLFNSNNMTPFLMSPLLNKDSLRVLFRYNKYYNIINIFITIFMSNKKADAEHLPLSLFTKSHYP